MKITITGGAGFLGAQLARRLLSLDQLNLQGAGSQDKAVDKLVLFDMTEPPQDLLDDPRVETCIGDITKPADVAAAMGGDTGGIFHLAAVVSGAAEEDFDLGMKVNLGGTQVVLEAARAQQPTQSGGHPPRLVFASSVAVYGGDPPARVVDETPITPQTSYGAQKAAGEYLVTDYSRKGFIDGRAMRLPTIVVRPGVANKAASSFASAIIREPLNGIAYDCPVSPESAMALMSPRRVIDAFVHMFEIDGTTLGYSRALLLPGIRISMGEAEAALRKVAANRQPAPVRFKPDPEIQAIVAQWPQETWSARAEALGFKANSSVEEIIEAYIEDELS